MEDVEQAVRELEGLIQVLWAEYAELVGCFYSAQIANEERIVSRYRTPDEWRGFEIVRAALYRCLFLAMAKMIFDDDKKADNPSLKRLVRQFSNLKKERDSRLLAYLEDRFVERLKGRPEGTRERFHAHLEDIFAHWSSISKWPPWTALKTLRNKVIALTDLLLCEGEWRLIDVNQIELGVQDFDRIRMGIEDFLSAFSVAITAMSLNFGQIHEKGRRAAQTFWQKQSKPGVPRTDQ